MKIVVAMDSFKECLGAGDACVIVGEAIAMVRGDVEVIEMPMGDGGEGTAEAMMAGGGGEWIACEVTGPMAGMRVEAGFAWFGKTRYAVVEMATAGGLELLPVEMRNPMVTTTYGVGELIRAAIEHGAGKVILTVGGSATVDCGVGAAMAMGWRFFDGNGEEFIIGKSKLKDIAEIVGPDEEIGVEVVVLCDVANPLCGEDGAARVYGPQKGATEEMVEELEAGMANVGEIVRERLGAEILSLRGAGAAGGLAGGAAAFFGGRLVSGIAYLMEHCGLAEELKSADWVITGEGKFDSQSLSGKVVSGVIKAAKDAGTKVAVIAGQVSLSEQEQNECGADAVLSCMGEGLSEYEAMAMAERLLGDAAVRFVMEELELE